MPVIFCYKILEASCQSLCQFGESIKLETKDDYKFGTEK